MRESIKVLRHPALSPRRITDELQLECHFRPHREHARFFFRFSLFLCFASTSSAARFPLSNRALFAPNNERTDLPRKFIKSLTDNARLGSAAVTAAASRDGCTEARASEVRTHLACEREKCSNVNILCER